MNINDILTVRDEIGTTPIVEAKLSGALPVYVERYLYQTNHVSIKGRACLTLVTLIGGSTAKEGKTHISGTIMPSQSILVPPNTPTHWQYSGTVDYCVFYLLDEQHSLAKSLMLFASASKIPLHFSDSLVAATGRQIVDELHKGPGADQTYMQLLTKVMFEQTYRALTTPAPNSINPSHVHLFRLQAVLNFIHGNLSKELSVTDMAEIVGLNESYFRQIFHEATGSTPHSYVLKARLEQARKLLMMTELPIAQIAADLGFSNQSHLTARFREAHAVTPAKFRQHLKQNS